MGIQVDVPIFGLYNEFTYHFALNRLKNITKTIPMDSD